MAIIIAYSGKAGAENVTKIRTNPTKKKGE
jgi:hypothetical protein